MSEGLVVIIGSGELGPSMRTTYRHLFEHVDASSITVLDTPFGFQANADDLTARIERHFQNGFGVKTRVASLRRPGGSGVDQKHFLEEVAASEVVFAGPGSPSYALRAWDDLDLVSALTAVVDRGGAVVMASAAAVTLGAKSIPVYEIYKVGADPVWLDGLNLLFAYGFSVTVVPHWNNREGGFHDTSHCFIGSHRFRVLVEQLPNEVSVLGIDEHTSLSIHTTTGTLRVLGAGKGHFNETDFDNTMSAPGFVTRPAMPKPPPEPEPGNTWQPVIELLIEMRDNAREHGEFDLADSIREKLAASGVELRDGPDGTTWFFK